MPNWIPGPWRWVNHDGVAYLRAEANIATSDIPDFDGLDPIVDDGSAGGEYSQTIDPTTSPYAPLLEAAPDLYTALEELLKFGQHEGPCDNCDPETGEPYDEAGACDAHWNACKAREQIARAALAKARGEKPSC